MKKTCEKSGHHQGRLIYYDACVLCNCVSERKLPRIGQMEGDGKWHMVAFIYFFFILLFKKLGICFVLFYTVKYKVLRDTWGKIWIQWTDLRAFDRLIFLFVCFKLFSDKGWPCLQNILHINPQIHGMHRKTSCSFNAMVKHLFFLSWWVCPHSRWLCSKTQGMSAH